MTAVEFLGTIGDAGFTVVVVVTLTEWLGFAEAEARDRKVRSKFAGRGEKVPEGMVPPRNLLPPRLRTIGNVVVKVAFVVGAVATVAHWIIR